MIGIVGGGVAGLAAAYRLQRHGHEVTVYEASPAVGGLAHTYETAGDPIEAFYHHLSKTEETIVELIEELGLGDDLDWPIGKNAYYVDGVVHPLDTAWEIAAYPHMSLYDKFRLGMLVKGIDVRGGWPTRGTYDSLEAFEDVGIEEFVVEHTTRGVYDNFVAPLLDGKYGDRADDVSAAWFLGRVKFRGERDLLRGEPLGYLEGGFGRLLDALVEAVGPENIETNARVTDLRIEDGAVQRLTADVDGKRVTQGVEAAIVAAMPDVLEALAGYECDVEFQGTICSLVSLEESVTDTYWLNVAEDVPFGALIEHTNYVPESRYGGEHLLYVPRYVQDESDPYWGMSDDEVEAAWLDGIEGLFPDFERDSVNWIRTARNPRTAPVYEQGYLEKVVPYDLSGAVAEGLYYAGMASRAQYPERSLNGGIVAGYECADRIAGAAGGERATAGTPAPGTRESEGGR